MTRTTLHRSVTSIPISFFDGHHIGAVVDKRREVVHPVGERHDLIPRPVLAELFEGGVQESDVGRDFDHRLAVELADQAKHAVRRRVLRPDVDEHLLGAELRLRHVEGRQRARRPGSPSTPISGFRLTTASSIVRSAISRSFGRAHGKASAPAVARGAAGISSGTSCGSPPSTSVSAP